MSNIVPASRPQMTRDEVMKLITPYEVEQYELIFVGIRGYYKKTMGNPVQNDFGIYDDAIFQIAPGYFKAFNANTDPSVLRPGIAQLKLGKHLYKKGKHHILSPTGYAAFRPANEQEKLPVWRDGKDGWGIAINIHKGSLNSTSSEGCQTIYPLQWEEFQKTGYAEMDKYGQTIVPYVLIEL